MQVSDCLPVARQLKAIEIGGFLQERPHPTPLAQQRQRLRELHLVVEFSESNHIPATTAAVAVKQVLVGIYQEAGVVIRMQRTQSHPSATAQGPSRLPMVGLHIVAEPVCQPLRRLLPAAVGVGIKAQVDGSPAVAKLPKLVCIEMVSDRAGDIVKTGLPQYGIIEQTLDENYFRIAPDLLPAIRARLKRSQGLVARWSRSELVLHSRR